MKTKWIIVDLPDLRISFRVSKKELDENGNETGRFSCTASEKYILVSDIPPYLRTRIINLVKNALNATP